MNCPNCGEEMERGYLAGRAPTYWTPKKQKLTVIRGNEDVTLQGMLAWGQLPAHICRACRRVVVEY